MGMWNNFNTLLLDSTLVTFTWVESELKRTLLREYGSPPKLIWRTRICFSSINSPVPILLRELHRSFVIRNWIASLVLPCNTLTWILLTDLRFTQQSTQWGSEEGEGGRLRFTDWTECASHLQRSSPPIQWQIISGFKSAVYWIAPHRTTDLPCASGGGGRQGRGVTTTVYYE